MPQDPLLSQIISRSYDTHPVFVDECHVPKKRCKFLLFFGNLPQLVVINRSKPFYEHSQKSFVEARESESTTKGFEQNHMHEEYEIIAIEKPDDSVWDVVGWGLHNYNVHIAGDPQSQQLCFVVRSPSQEIVGGLIGNTYWDWFYLDLLFVKEEFRGCGHGHRLLDRAEQEARKRGAKHVYLDTFSFQAPDFYKQHGYQVFGELKEFPPGHQRYFFTKQL